MKTFHWIIVGIVMAMAITPLFAEPRYFTFGGIKPIWPWICDTLLPEEADSIIVERAEGWPKLSIEVKDVILKANVNTTKDLAIKYFYTNDTSDTYCRKRWSIYKYDSMYVCLGDTSKGDATSCGLPAGVFNLIILHNRATTDTLIIWANCYPWKQAYTLDK